MTRPDHRSPSRPVKEDALSAEWYLTSPNRCHGLRVGSPQTPENLRGTPAVLASTFNGAIGPCPMTTSSGRRLSDASSRVNSGMDLAALRRGTTSAGSSLEVLRTLSAAR